jgi:membrane-associated phospholipid phosphatase
MSLTSLDYAGYRAVNGLTGNAHVDRVLTDVANALPAILVAMVALTFLLPFGRACLQRRRGAVLATASAAIALLINQPISHLVSRTRPYLAHPAHAHLLIARSHDPSFPSDHATGGFALAVAVFLYDRTIGTILLVLAGVLSFARVFVGTHYPGDVVAGALIGGAVAAGLFLVPFSRRGLEAVADRCGAIWDATLRRLHIPASRAGLSR